MNDYKQIVEYKSQTDTNTDTEGYVDIEEYKSHTDKINTDTEGYVDIESKLM